MQSTQPGVWLDRLSVALAALYALDRGLKLAAVIDFFRRPAPPPPASWPSVTLLQPITQGASDLQGALAARSALHYAGPIQHLLICDDGDTTSLHICRVWMEAQPAGSVELVLAPGGPQPAAQGSPTSSGDWAPRAVASKLAKLQAALPRATGEVLCFVDDDVAPRPDALSLLVRHLLQPGVGAVFGLASYSNWSNIWSSLMSGFVNANALLSYVPLAYLMEPYTITGHIFALRHTLFDAAGGFHGLEHRLDDDHELARRVRRLGVRCEQTPVVYDVDNQLATFSGYANQMHRWFTIPRLTMVPYLTPREQMLTLAGSLGTLILPLLALLALLTRRRRTWQALLTACGTFGAVYLTCERCFTRDQTPLRRWSWVLVAALIAPLQALLALLGSDSFDWRGQQVQLQRNGTVSVTKGRE